MSFRDRVVVVTGSGQGIGKAIALAFLKRQAHVIIVEIDEAKGKAACQELAAHGHCCFFRTDVADENQVKLLGEQIDTAYGRVDILVNNAAIGVSKSLMDVTLKEWERVLAVNLTAPFLCTKYLSPLMSDSLSPSVVNIASTRALMSEPDTLPYTASKGGLVALTHGLAVSLAGKGIRVNCISPGWIETGEYGGLRDCDHRQHPAGRVGKPEDIAEACLYLASPTAGFVTGSNFVVDGGMTRKMYYEP